MLFPPARRHGGDRLRGVEELHESSVQGILGADHDKASVLDQSLENLRAVAQMVHRNADIGSNGVPHEGIHIVRKFGLEQPLDGRPDPVND